MKIMKSHVGRCASTACREWSCDFTRPFTCSHNTERCIIRLCTDLIRTLTSFEGMYSGLDLRIDVDHLALLTLHWKVDPNLRTQYFTCQPGNAMSSL